MEMKTINNVACRVVDTEYDVYFDMALTMLERAPAGGTVGALRYVVSLAPVNRQILLLSGLLFVFILLIMVFFALSGLYFINSIVTPVEALCMDFS